MTPSKNAPRSSSSASRSAGRAPSDSPHASTPSDSLFPDVELPVENPIVPLAQDDTTNLSVREHIELVPEVDQTLRSIATAIGMTPRDVLGHLLAYVTQRVREHLAAEGGGDLLPPETPDRTLEQTVVLRGIRIPEAGRNLLRRWTRTSGRSVSALVTERILQIDDRLSDVGDSEASSSEHPLDAYQRLLDVLHERDRE